MADPTDNRADNRALFVTAVKDGLAGHSDVRILNQVDPSQEYIVMMLCREGRCAAVTASGLDNVPADLIPSFAAARLYSALAHLNG